MRKLRVLAAGIAGAAAVALVFELAEPKSVQAAVATLVDVANVPNVNVANTPNVNVANTVPVTGAVSINSLPAIQLSGPVNVANATDSRGGPVLLVQKDGPRNSFEAYGTCTFGTSGCGSDAIYTVPAGEIAVVQSYSGTCTLAVGGDQINAVSLSHTGAPAPVDAFVVPGPPIFGGGITSQNFRASLTGVYIPGDGSVMPRAVSVLNEAGNNSVCQFVVSGYLVHQ